MPILFKIFCLHRYIKSLSQACHPAEKMCGKLAKSFVCFYSLRPSQHFSAMLGRIELVLCKKWLCLLVSSADNLCKQFRSRSDLTKRRAWSWSKLLPLRCPVSASPITLFVYVRLYDVLVTHFLITFTALLLWVTGVLPQKHEFWGIPLKAYIIVQ